jgi:hypothetical protein
MKKKIILLFFCVMNFINAKDTSDLKIIHSYKNIPFCFLEENTLFQSVIVCAAWAAKYTIYNFSVLEDNDELIFIAYNDECIFALHFNQVTDECIVEFNADDDSFDYAHFKTIIDSYFLYNEERPVLVINNKTL